MGLGFIAQVGRIPGMQVTAVADVQPGRAAEALSKNGIDAATGSDLGALSRAIEAGGSVAVEDAALLVALPVDIIVDASGVPEVGAQIAFSGLLAGKDIALLNVECDVTIGPGALGRRPTVRSYLQRVPRRRACRSQAARRLRA